MSNAEIIFGIIAVVFGGGGAAGIIITAIQAGSKLGEMLTELKNLNHTVEKGFEDNRDEHIAIGVEQAKTNEDVGECKIKLATLCGDKGDRG